MKVFLNQESAKQLETLMARTGIANHTHCINVLISTVANNLRRADLKASTMKAANF